MGGALPLGFACHVPCGALQPCQGSMWSMLTSHQPCSQQILWMSEGEIVEMGFHPWLERKGTTLLRQIQAKEAEAEFLCVFTPHPNLRDTKTQVDQWQGVHILCPNNPQLSPENNMKGLRQEVVICNVTSVSFRMRKSWSNKGTVAQRHTPLLPENLKGVKHFHKPISPFTFDIHKSKHTGINYNLWAANKP